MSNPPIYSLIDKAISDYSMIEKGDRILLAISGGKDSTVMAEYFYQRKKRRNSDFEVIAFHVGTQGIAPILSKELEDKFEDWGIKLIKKDIDVFSRLKDGKKMNCWFCSTQRRLELSLMAQKMGCKKIALGHHLDDVLETLIMNMLGKKSLFTMPPILKFQKFPITIIRPLCLCDEMSIINHATDSHYICATCTCSYQKNSSRKDAKKRIQALTSGSYKLKRNIFESLHNIKVEYLP